MKREGNSAIRMLITLTSLVTTFGLWLPISVTFGEQTPAEPSIVMQSKFETIAPTAPFDFIMQVFELEPGGGGVVHVHSSAAFLMVLQGEFTNFRIVDGQRAEPETYRAGDTLVEPAWGIVHEIGNLGSVPMRYLSPRMQPKDAPVTIALPIASARPGAPPQRAVHRASTEVINIGGPVDLYETWTDWPPGSRSPAHFHPGIELGIVMEGELTITKATGTTTVRTGESFVNGVGEIHATSNDTTERASVLTAYLVASGRPLTFAAE